MNRKPYITAIFLIAILQSNFTNLYSQEPENLYFVRYEKIYIDRKNGCGGNYYSALHLKTFFESGKNVFFDESKKYHDRNFNEKLDRFELTAWAGKSFWKKSQDGPKKAFYYTDTLTYRFSVYAEYGKACKEKLGAEYFITADGPVEIEDINFIDEFGTMIDDKSTACLNDNYRIRVETNKFFNYPNHTNAVLQIWNRNNQWVTIKSGLSKSGDVTIFTPSKISEYVDLGSPIRFRTRKKLIDGNLSTFTSRLNFFFFPRFELGGPGYVSVIQAKCKGESPSIFIPYVKHDNYIITISNPNGQGYNFNTSELTKIAGYYIIDKDTEYTNDNCTSNCKPNFIPGLTYDIKIEHAKAKEYDKTNTPCAFKSSFRIDTMPDYLITKITLKDTVDRAGNPVHIKKIGGLAEAMISVEGSTRQNIQIITNGITFYRTLNETNNIDGTEFYSGTMPILLTKGINLIEARNDNNCSTTYTTEEVKQTPPIRYISSGITPDCAQEAISGNKNATIKISTPSGGIGQLTFSPTESKVTGGYEFRNVPIVNNYARFKVGDTYGNGKWDSVEFSPVLPVTIDTAMTKPSMSCQKDGKVHIIDAMNGISPYRFSRDSLDFSPSLTITGYSSGNHNIYIADDNNCVYKYPITMPQAPPPLSIFLDTSVAPTCLHDKDGKYFLSLDGVLGNVGAEGDARIQSSNIYYSRSEITFDSLYPGDYIIQVSDTLNGKKCDTRFSFTIPEKPALDFISNVAPVIGKGTATGIINMDVLGGNPGTKKVYLLEGTTPIDSILSTDGTARFEGLTGQYENGGKNYYLNVVDGKGCQYLIDNGSYHLFKVREPEDTLNIDLVIEKPISCNGDSDAQVRMLPSGGWGQYEFAHEKSTFTVNDLFASLTSGGHEFFVSDSMGATDSASINIIMPEKLYSSITGIDSVLCFEGATGAVRFNSNGGTAPYRQSILGAAQNWEQSDTSKGLSEGTYQFIFTDKHNCLGEDTLTAYVPQPEKLEFLEKEVVQTTCNTNNGKIAVKMVGGSQPYFYIWTNFDGDTISTTNTIENLAQSGYYTLDVKDKNGCPEHFEQAINPSNGPQIDSVSTEPVSCYGGSNGKATLVKVTDGTPYSPWTINWSDNTTERKASGFVAGKHSVSVTDKNNCTYTKYFDIATPDSLYAELIDSKDPHCFGYNDAFLEVNPHGGVGACTYNWSNGDTGPRANNLVLGTYILELSDSNGCIYTQSYSINQPEKVLVDIGEDVLMCPGNSFVADGKEFSAYEWKVDGTTISNERYLNIEKAGSYTLIATDGIGCFAYDTLEVKVGNNALKAEFLLPSHSTVGDTIWVFEISNLALDSLKWKYKPQVFEEATPEGWGMYALALDTKQEGIHNLALHAYSGGCTAIKIKQVELHPASDSIGTDWVGYQEPLIQNIKVMPNPNNGYFDLVVGLREAAGIKVAIFDVNAALKIDEREVSGLEHYVLPYVLDVHTGLYLIIVSAEKEIRQVKMIVE